MQNTDSESETTYSALKENPLYLLSLINKYVKLELIKNVTIHGFVHSIDPIEYRWATDNLEVIFKNGDLKI